jgi:hypothetical protein
MTFLFLPSLLCFALPGSPGALAPAPIALVREDDKAYTELERAFEDAGLAWRREVRAAQKAKDAAAEAALDARNPLKEFYPRFAALEEAGSANAALWMATRVEELESDAPAVAAQKQKLFAHAIRGLGATKAAEDILRALKKQEKFLDAPLLEACYLDLANAAQDAEVGSGARLARGKSLLLRAETPEEREKALQALEELVKAAPESKAAKSIAGLIYEYRNLSVGCVAPSFSTEDVDGAAFQLSDYRGKVVLVDFWGFW